VKFSVEDEVDAILFEVALEERGAEPKTDAMMELVSTITSLQRVMTTKLNYL